MTHFLDASGNISERMHKEGRELASFIALLIDWTTQEPDFTVAEDEWIYCFAKGCQGVIFTNYSPDETEIEWECSQCDNSGRISEWQGTKWNNLPKWRQ